MRTLPPSQLSHELRETTSPDLARRRWTIGLTILGSVAAQLVALYQTGILERLPDPPVGPFDSEKVDASDYAYKRLQTPDGFLMLGSYATTGALVAAGGRERAAEQPWLPIAAAAKVAYDVLTTVKLTREEWAENRALCFYCQVASAASAVSLALVLPEAARAARQLARA